MAGVTFKYGGKDIGLLQYLEDRLSRNPSSAFFAMLAYFYLEIDKIGEALSVAQRGVIAHPDYSTGHAVLAMAMMKARLYADARRELLKASNLHPGSKIVDMLTAELARLEESDSVGKKIAEEYRGSAGQEKPSGEPDIMKKVEETLKKNRPPKSQEDFLIPGIDAIVGSEFSRVQRKFAESLNRLESRGAKKRGDEPAPEPARPLRESAREIIDRVTRDSEGKPEDRPVSEIPEPGTSASQADDFDLDALARDLVAAGPIKPRKDDADSGGRDEDSGIELSPEIVTDTLAMIFEQQGQTKTAIEAYTILISKKPERADFYRERIAILSSRNDAPR